MEMDRCVLNQGEHKDRNRALDSLEYAWHLSTQLVR